MGNSIILFHSNNHAIWTSKVLKKNGIKYKMVPVPRHLSSDCGYCVRVSDDDTKRVESLIKETGIEYDGIVGLPSESPGS